MFSLHLYRTLGHLLTPILKGLVPPSRKGILPPAELWLHAASVGEANVAAAIIKALRLRRPETRILLTLQTSAGLARARKLLETEGVSLALAPFDLPHFVKEAFQRVRPRVLALVETELWPNLILEARRRGVSLLLVNGRLSEKAFRRYRLHKGLWQKLLKSFGALGVIGPQEAERFRALGAPSERLYLLGNAKYDLLQQRKEKLSLKEARKKLPSSKQILTFGSLRKGEEKEVLKAVVKFLKKFSGRICLVLAPRHLKRIKEYERNLKKLKIPYSLWSKLPQREAPVILLDAIGPLFEIYALSFAAFVGGSLVPRGGQNPLEPALLGRPLLFGPFMDNFPYEAKALKNCGKIQVRDGEEIFEKFSFWLENPEEAQEIGQKASLVAREFLGASTRYAALLAEALTLPPS